MKILIIDPIGGISGDMLLASLIHLGCPEKHLLNTFEMLGTEPFHMVTKPDSINGIVCMSLKFDIPHSHHGRTYASIRDQILAKLPDNIKGKAESIFKALAAAEAQVHGIDIDDVHFHEVGALDSILDIVGIAAAIDYLGIDEIYSKPIPLGEGITESLHGKIPVPAPATVKLLEGTKIRSSTINAELTTPTGAAVIKALVKNIDPPSEMIIKSVGYGCGTKRFDNWPNLLRVMLCEKTTSSEQGHYFLK